MGFPLTTYTTLLALVDHEGSPYGRDLAVEALAPFSLFTFVLHDPDAHLEFDAVISEDFDRFDYETGDKLLFFSLVDPDPEWLRRYRGRAYYQPLRDVDRHGEATTGDMLAALASSFGIAPEDLPCLVVLPDLTASEFVWIRTCPERVGDQLRQLGYIADRDPQSWSSPEALRQLDLCGGTDYVEVGRQAASLLLDLLAFSDLEQDGMVQHLTKRHRAAFFRGFNAALERARRASPVLFERLAQQFLSALGLSWSPRPLEVPILGLEPESERIYRSSLIAERALEFSVDWGALRGAGLEGADYSPPAIGLAKVFEREVNLSIVHWARRELGIDLPPYFNLHAPNVTATVSTGGDRTANFNGLKRGRWNPPPMGTARHGCKAVAKQTGSLPNRYDQQAWGALLRPWHEINQLRNDVAHDRLLTRGDFHALKALMSELKETGHWSRMMQLKSFYRGNMPPLANP